MPIDLERMRELMKASGMKVYRDEAPTDAEYPYIIYEFVNEQNRRSSNKVFADLPLYQIAVVTDGIETGVEPLKEIFNEKHVPYAGFIGMPDGMENDCKITQFVTYVRCVQ